MVPNILDTARFYPPSEKSPRSVAQILVARNLEAIYGIDIAIKVLQQVLEQRPDARMLIAGSGPEKNHLQVMAKDLGVEHALEFTGRLQPDAIAELMRTSSVLLNPTRVDNSPNSVIEAMASGLPVVASDVGGLSHLITSEDNGILVPSENSRAAAEAVLRVLGEPSLAGRLSASGLRASEKFQWDAVSRLLDEIYATAMEQRL